MSFDFENGTMAKTRFECRQTRKEIELVILPTEGSYQGMKDKRVYKVILNIEDTPSQLWINDIPTENWKIEDQVLHVSLPRVDAREKQILKIKLLEQ